MASTNGYGGGYNFRSAAWKLMAGRLSSPDIHSTTSTTPTPPQGSTTSLIEEMRSERGELQNRLRQEEAARKQHEHARNEAEQQLEREKRLRETSDEEKYREAESHNQALEALKHDLQDTQKRLEEVWKENGRLIEEHAKSLREERVAVQATKDAFASSRS
ncbi:hypothetical protein D9758_018247 [Tetrapyrgos nigripes]|uniref:Uncharacterized protein n=1 Tax=Tetrapyrgos nigripes TaxID=182062 RepID=A0A8H5C5I5_9AGAR|nr:hypothetical protein D9758_018247 [Tetrapyrgos nigripes]